VTLDGESIKKMTKVEFLLIFALYKPVSVPLLRQLIGRLPLSSYNLPKTLAYKSLLNVQRNYFDERD
jgi:hypothetical protein